MTDKPFFYSCYLLRSCQPGRRIPAYIGSTLDPSRRLRQHNGLIKGGAQQTIKWRPWEMVAIVYGFPSDVTALQFEWAWQNPHKSRHFKKDQFSETRSNMVVKGKLKVLSKMLHLEYWARWPLKIQFTVLDVQEMFKTFQAPPPHIVVTFGSVSTVNVGIVSPDIPDLQTETDCIICYETLNLQDQSSWLRCSRPKCKMRGHLVCLSSWFIEEECQSLQDRQCMQLLPINGTCPICRLNLVWGDLVADLKLRVSGLVQVRSSIDGECIDPNRGETNCTDLDAVDISDDDLVIDLNDFISNASLLDTPYASGSSRCIDTESAARSVLKPSGSHRSCAPTSDNGYMHQPAPSSRCISNRSASSIRQTLPSRPMPITITLLDDSDNESGHVQSKITRRSTASSNLVPSIGSNPSSHNGTTRLTNTRQLADHQELTSDDDDDLLNALLVGNR
ncbi:hypothetical protein BATDEDRAFT_87437 [Batrachochytrium dendrobatidis JAM81]|uniref:GIY-YIG domain-containing protein n=2 Tax=Batrachochytrium dendrobatidis TaxID=109871 RepID=F4P011_BATDJ|nr:endonuclease [Batrachochytrium dendrobatidis JAM81]EGF81182.1 hypothetical protein BATDEDRAFT_87437 [Batrachochytrium dendrobatidis JAM81]KAJ8326027.1 Slx4p interacting protein [Batrachochytrium dendrobatidis]KAK5670024.1 Slx4p interacting protein [Batrachochytrium dendrobatidis]OAJ38346.1 hypothetical protein BDEG_22290 [Batrachochytrium dendrobatidis JEL423]|eukprot:XP_006678112.1 hypothetical protein BATDEDRAFT_87437 [Batrachochytrium dendrobatidis JAM81]